MRKDASRAHPCVARQAASLVRRDRQKVKEERKGLRGEPLFGGTSSFAGLGVPFLSRHVVDFWVFRMALIKAVRAPTLRAKFQ